MRRLATYILIFGLSVSSLLPLSALAVAAPSKPPTMAGQGIEISPPIIELKADPGQILTTEIKLRNITKGDLTVSGLADDIKTEGETGVPQILFDEKEATRYSLKYWIPTLPTIQIAPGQIKSVNVTINIPSNAEPGGHYGVIRFTASASALSDKTGLALSTSLGSLVLLRINGAIQERSSLLDFYASKGGRAGHFFESLPLTFVERIKNEGTIHIKPSGNIDITDLFGHKVATLDFNGAPSHIILPDSIRRFEQIFGQDVVGKRFMFGYYRADLGYLYGDNNSVVKRTFGFWVIPYRLILLWLLLLVGVLWVVKRLLRSYKQKILRQSRRK